MAFLLGEDSRFTWHYCLSLWISFPQRFGSLTRSSQARECDNRAGASLSTAGTACVLPPRATQSFINSFVEATCKRLSIFHSSGSGKVWRVWMNGKQPESGGLVCTWQRDGENLFSLLRPRRLSAITPAQMSLLDNNASNWQNSGDTACVVACA